jgi:hypothetical protein
MYVRSKASNLTHLLLDVCISNDEFGFGFASSENLALPIPIQKRFNTIFHFLRLSANCCSSQFLEKKRRKEEMRKDRNEKRIINYLPSHPHPHVTSFGSLLFPGITTSRIKNI